MSAEKTCFNCHYSKVDVRRQLEDFYLCTHPKNVRIDAVTGKEILANCYAARGVGGECGPFGNLWAPEDSEKEMTP